MARIKDPDLVKDLMDFSFSPAVATQDIHSPAAHLANNPHARAALWEWLQANWDTVDARLRGNTVVYDRFVKLALPAFSTREMKTAVEAFFREKDTKSFQRGFGQALDAVESNVRYRERDEGVIREWLEVKGYM